MNARLRNQIGVAALLVVVAAVVVYRSRGPFTGRPIKVGILHSETGTMAISEQAVRDATLLAIDEINRAGGLLGRRIEPVVADGKSDGPTFAREAERLIHEEQVSVVFGCWTSASRKTVKPIFEKHNHLLFYPVQYEGLEQSPNIVYTGAAPNQQMVPAVKFCLDHLGRKFFLMGSDYVFPRAANAIARDQIVALGAEVVGEEYVLLGGTDFQAVVQKIVAAQPDVILNTVNGDSNIAFFRELRRAGITPAKIPTMSFSVAEQELSTLDAKAMAGDYACWNYFQSLDTAENRAFVAGFRQKYGAERVTDDPIEAGYFGVYLWAQAVQDAKTDQVTEVLKKLANQSFPAPGGIVSIDYVNHHTWKIVRVGKITANGQFDIVWSSDRPVGPVPYPVYRSAAEWDDFLNKMSVAWGGQWANPGITPQTVANQAAEHTALIVELAGRAAIVSAVKAAHEQRRTLGKEEIERLDTVWQTSEGLDETTRACLANPAAHVLTEFQRQHPQFREILITDAVGLNVAMTNRTSDYYQADEAWWVEAYDAGKGKVCSGELEYDRSARVWGMAICVPIVGHQQEAIGVMKAFLSINHVLDAKDL